MTLSSETPSEGSPVKGLDIDNSAFLISEAIYIEDPAHASNHNSEPYNAESESPNESKVTVTSQAVVPLPLPPESVPTSNSESSFSEKTERIRAVAQLLHVLKPLFWAFIIIFVFFPLMGRMIAGFSMPNHLPTIGSNSSKPPVVVVDPFPVTKGMDQALTVAIQSAREDAQEYAANELEDWQQELTPRVDNFLNWYFDYFNQKRMEFTVPFTYVTSAIRHFFQPESLNPKDAVAESLTAEFQREFAKQVLIPRSAQLRFENITKDTVDLFLFKLSEKVNLVQSQYQVPQGQWDRYLSDIATTISDTEGNISNVSLKVLVGGGGYLAAKPFVAMAVGKIGSKVTAKLASKAATKVAVKTGSALAAELGTSLIDPLVGIGILLWDIWDYNHTVANDRPQLRKALFLYLSDVERSLLSNSDTGIMSAIDQVEHKLLKSLHKR